MNIMKNIIIITGGTSGLGYELVKEAIKKDYFVCNLARNKEKMNRLDSEFSENYKAALYIRLSKEDLKQRRIRKYFKSALNFKTIYQR